MQDLVVNFLYETRLQGIMVVVVIILDWIFVLMNTTTMIPCRRVSQRQLAIEVAKGKINVGEILKLTFWA